MLFHFICRGNAFRSIIAEAYLNSLQIPGVQTMSSGTVADAHREINKDLYQSVLNTLERHNIHQFAKNHYGDQLATQSLTGNDVIVCMNDDVVEEAERVAKLPQNTVTWQINDVDVGNERAELAEAELNDLIEVVYQDIRRHVDNLITTIDPDEQKRSTS